MKECLLRNELPPYI